MGQDQTFDTMADLCILAGQAVMKDGSAELRAAMRIMLAILGREVARRTLEAGIGATTAGKTARATKRMGACAPKAARRTGRTVPLATPCL